MTRAETLEIQRQLGLMADGIYGPKTAAAYQAWLDANTTQEMPTPAPPAAKPWWTSRAIWGLLATVVANIAGRSGWVIDSEGLTNVLLQAVEVAGLALALFGTVRRTAPLDPGLVAPGLRLAGRPRDVSSPGQAPCEHHDGPFGY